MTTMNREELLQQINIWDAENHHQEIINAIEAMPREEWGYTLTGLLARAYNNLAMFGRKTTKEQHEMLEKAVALLESVREEGQEDDRWHFRMGYALYYLDRTAEALTCFRRVRELDPEDSDAVQFIVWCENAIVPIKRKRKRTNSSADGNSLLPTNEFAAQISPFFWVNHADSVSVSLNVGEYLQEVFDTRTEEGFEGGGYDWESLAKVFLEERKPDLIEKVKFDSESSMFCAYSEDAAALREFIVGFKNACENKDLILDLFSRAELD